MNQRLGHKMIGNGHADLREGQVFLRYLIRFMRETSLLLRRNGKKPRLKPQLLPLPRNEGMTMYCVVILLNLFKLK